VLRVSLVNPPFAAVPTPSLALTQLRSVLERELGGRVRVEIHYLNLEIARLMGRELYDLYATAGEGQSAGLGEWIFRRAAFPETADTDEEYFRRYFPPRREGMAAFRESALGLRDRLERRLRELIEERRLDRAQVVGMSSMFFQTTASIALATRLKELSPRLVTVLGGANCESPMGEELARHVDCLDFVVSGPSLVAFPRLVRHLLAGEEETCHAIPGVFSRRNLASGDVPGPLGEELPLDTEVALDYDSFLADLEGTFPGEKVRPHLLFETSRGCWWGAKAHCTFCGLNGSTMSHRAMSPERALAQFEALFRYWPRCDYFECVDNLMPHGYLRDVFPRLAPPQGARIFYEVKASLTADQMEMLARAGVRRMQAGIESLATSTLELMRKGTTSFQNVSFLMSCLRFRIEAVWNLLVGFPGEDEEVYRRAVADADRLVHLPPPTGVYTVRFDRFSPYHARAESYGLELRPYDFYELVFPFPREALANLAYYFMDHALEAEYVTAALRWMDRLREAVERWQRRWAAEAPPVLRFLDPAEGGRILDSRSGREERIDVGATGWRILDALGAPHDLERLARRLVAPSDRELEGQVARLADHGLLFREGDRMLSLVLPALPAEELPQPQLARLDRSLYRLRSDELPPAGRQTAR
jgi:magnesium-protoporphyrin IX monomethyl ester (oxidative) cyclase